MWWRMVIERGLRIEWRVVWRDRERWEGSEWSRGGIEGPLGKLKLLVRTIEEETRTAVKIK